MEYHLRILPYSICLQKKTNEFILLRNFPYSICMSDTVSGHGIYYELPQIVLFYSKSHDRLLANTISRTYHLFDTRSHVNRAVCGSNVNMFNTVMTSVWETAMNALGCLIHSCLHFEFMDILFIATKHTSCLGLFLFLRFATNISSHCAKGLFVSQFL